MKNFVLFSIISCCLVGCSKGTDATVTETAKNVEVVEAVTSATTETTNKTTELSKTLEVVSSATPVVNETVTTKSK